MAEKPRIALAGKVPHASFSLMGLGVVQTWIYLMMYELRAIIGIEYGYSQLFFDLGSVPMYLAFIMLARRFVPLFSKRSPIYLSVFIMLVGNGLMAAAALNPSLPDAVAVVALVISGCGSALAIICWWEVYGILNPVEVALYYAGSWILGEVLVFALAGYNPSYLLASTFFLPVIASVMLVRGETKIAEDGLAPKVLHGSTSFPWKPMLLVGLYSFAYGCGTWIVFYSDSIYMHLGTLVPALVVCASILFAYRKFNFTVIYRFVLPAAIAGLLALLLVPNINADIATFFIRMSYIAIEIYACVLLCNLSRRYHISAAWLCSLFNITHIICLGMGTLMFDALPSLVIVGVCIICIVLVTSIIVTEPNLTSDWRIISIDKDGALNERASLEIAVSILAKQYGLSSREYEVLSLFAQGSMPRSIGRELHIAPGTVKAHIQHIYKKTGVHSKEELSDLLKG